MQLGNRCQPGGGPPPLQQREDTRGSCHQRLMLHSRSSIEVNRTTQQQPSQRLPFPLLGRCYELGGAQCIIAHPPAPTWCWAARAAAHLPPRQPCNLPALATSRPHCRAFRPITHLKQGVVGGIRWTVSKVALLHFQKQRRVGAASMLLQAPCCSIHPWCQLPQQPATAACPENCISGADHVLLAVTPTNQRRT